MKTLDKRIVIAALSNPERALNAWNHYKEDVEIRDYPSDLSWAGGYIFFNLRKIGIEDKYLRNIYRYNYLTNNFRFAQVAYILKQLNEKFGITPLKSFGLSQFEHSLGQRPIGDFDFYIDPVYLNRCIEMLNENKFLPLMGITKQIFEYQIRDLRGSWNFVNAEGIDLDVHWRIFDHLSEKENKQLVQSNAILNSGKYGIYKGLNLELATLQIGYHQELSSTLHWGSLFDFVSLLKMVNRNNFLELSKRTELYEVIKKWIVIAEENLEEELFKLPKEKARKHVEWQRYFHVTPSRFRQKKLLNRNLLYTFWEFLGSYSYIERFLINHLGVFSKYRGSLLIEEDRDLLTGVEMQLGIGWHYRYPNEDFRWVNYPDARIVAQNSKARNLIIHLAQKQWQQSETKAFDVFASGIYVGTCDKTSDEFAFSLPLIQQEEFELSIRKRPEDRRKIKGVNFIGKRFLAPIKNIHVN